VVRRVVEALPEDVGRVGGASEDEVAVVEENGDGVVGGGAMARVDQMTDLVAWSRMTRLPSPEMASSGEEGSTTGLSPLALQSGVSLGTLLNHMPRYVLGLLVVWRKGVLSGLKKPSANLLLLETSLLLLPTSPLPGDTVSVAAEQDACRERSPRRTTT